jgi:2-keto-4-pentenoate hydratase/2-oxohepta-3-ene-1,7-dioic acid hydratase in catechol pathway
MQTIATWSAVWVEAAARAVDHEVESAVALGRAVRAARASEWLP